MSSWVPSTGNGVVVGSDNLHSLLIFHRNPTTCRASLEIPVFSRTRFRQNLTSLTVTRSQFSSNPQTHEQEGDPETIVEALKVPDQWFIPSKALEESEWLRVTMHKWLDDEYCPEPTNVEISKIAAESYYDSLVDKQADLGEILLKMARKLESISYQESFHGAFSSANAAINLIVEKMEKAAL